MLKGTGRKLLALVAFCGVFLAWAGIEVFGLTNNLATALTITSGVEQGFDTGATIGLGILVFLVALGFVLKGIKVGRKAS